MSIPDDYKAFVEPHRQETFEFFAGLEKDRGRPLTEEEKEDLWQKGLWRLALMKAGVDLPVPQEITREMVMAMPPAELGQFLWDYLCVFMSENDVYRDDGHCRERETILNLPRGLRVLHSLLVLDSEIHNGGFEQFFGNSENMFNDITLEDLQYVGAVAQAEKFQEAIAENQAFHANCEAYKQKHYQDSGQVPSPGIDDQLDRAFWREYRANREPGIPRLDLEYYALQDSDLLWERFEQYAAAHPEEFVHSRITDAMSSTDGAD